MKGRVNSKRYLKQHQQANFILQGVDGSMNDEERIQAALTNGGLMKLEGESQEDFIRLSHKFVQRLGSPLSQSQWEHNIKMLFASAERQFEKDRGKDSAQPETIKRRLHAFYIKEDYEYIVGDLLEEHSQFRSKIEACWWLVRQIFKSIIPLVYKAAKESIISRLGGLMNRRS